jgi:hypothetical protein
VAPDLAALADPPDVAALVAALTLARTTPPARPAVRPPRAVGTARDRRRVVAVLDLLADELAATDTGRHAATSRAGLRAGHLLAGHGLTGTDVHTYAVHVLAAAAFAADPRRGLASVTETVASAITTGTRSPARLAGRDGV